MSFWTKIMAALSPLDLDSLERLCRVVDASIATYREAGAALTEIRDRQLFRATHRTFEDFCKSRWEMTPQHAGRIMAAAALALKLEPTGSIPRTERLARPIVGLPENEQLATWKETQQLAAGDPVRPEHVRAAVSKRRPATKKAGRAKPIRLRVPGGIVVIEPGRGFESAETCLTFALEQLSSKRQAA